VIRKVLFGAAIVLLSAVATATPAGADPSLYAVLSCNCEGTTTVVDYGPSLREQIDAGIQSGMADLLGEAG